MRYPETRDAAKARGGFYTPPEIAMFMAGWAIRNRSDRVLEPSAGDGSFARCAVQRLRGLGATGADLNLVAVEHDDREATTLATSMPGISVLAQDFFEVDVERAGRFDAVIGNPPYIRYQGFTGPTRAKAQLRAKEQGVLLSDLASSWAHFVAHSLAFLAPSGRLALVLPAELSHTDYARPIRESLAARFNSICIVLFDQQVFPGAQVDAVLLLASSDEPRGLSVVRTANAASLGGLDLAAGTTQAFPARRWSAAMSALGLDAYAAVSASPKTIRLGTIASVDIGFVSGANDFFLLSHEDAVRRELPSKVLVRALRRPSDVSGLSLQASSTFWLLRPVDPADGDLPTVARYLAEGAASGVSARYTCRVRRPWFTVPLPRTQPDAFLPYMNHYGPRLIVNDARSWSSNLLHGVTLGILAPDVHALAVAMASTVTLLSAEVEGRSYGGGVLKLETKEAERLLVPTIPGGQVAALIGIFPEVSQLIADGDIQAAAIRVDDVLGFDHDYLWTAYLTYRSRRLGRKRAVA